MMTSQERQQQGLPDPQPITPEPPSDLLPQPSEHPIPGNANLHWGDGGNPYSDGHPETSPDVRAVASSGQAAVEGSPSLGNEARLSASVASRHTNRSQPANDVGLGEGTPRAASVEEEIKRKPTTAKEYGVGRKLSKIEKRGARVEKVALDIALQELAEIQGLQEASIKEEAGCRSFHSRALSDAHKADMDLLTARTAHERGQAGLRAAGEVLEASRKHVNETTEMLRKKMEEVDRLRAVKKVDNKERAIKTPVRRVSLFL